MAIASNTKNSLFLNQPITTLSKEPHPELKFPLATQATSLKNPRNLQSHTGPHHLYQQKKAPIPPTHHTPPPPQPTKFPSSLHLWTLALREYPQVVGGSSSCTAIRAQECYIDPRRRQAGRQAPRGPAAHRYKRLYRSTSCCCCCCWRCRIPRRKDERRRARSVHTVRSTIL